MEGMEKEVMEEEEGGGRKIKKIKEYPMRLVVRSLKAEEKKSEEGGNEDIDWIVEFHLVDVNNKNMVLNYIPSSVVPSDGIGGGGAAICNDSLFVLGGFCANQDTINRSTSSSRHPQLHPHKGGSRFSFLSKSWSPVEVPNNRGLTNPAVLSDTLYCFGACYLRPEFFTPIGPSPGGIWNPISLPSHFSFNPPCYVNIPVLPDPTNSRILVHVDCNHLYAFHPTKDNNDEDVSHDGVSWRLLAPSFPSWSHVAAVSDDILYFHHPYSTSLFSAYHIPSAKWFNKVVSDFSRVDTKVVSPDYDAFLSFGLKGLLCLATWLPCFRDGSVSVHFLRFKVEPTLEPHFEVKFTALDYQIFSIPSTHTVLDFLVLPPEFSY